MALITDPSGLATDTSKKMIVMHPRQHGKSMTMQQMYAHTQRMFDGSPILHFNDPVWCEVFVLESLMKKPETTIYTMYGELAETVRSLSDKGYIYLANVHEVYKGRIRFNAFVTRKGREYFDMLGVMDEL